MEDYGRKLLDVLVSNRLLKASRAQEVLERSAEEEVSPEVILHCEALLPRDRLLAAKSALLEFPGIDLETERPDPAVASLLPQAMAKRYRAVCLYVQGEHMGLAMDDPTDAFATSYIKMRTGFELDLKAALSMDVDRALEEVYAHGPTPGVAPDALRHRIGQEVVRARTVHVPREVLGDDSVSETPRAPKVARISLVDVPTRDGLAGAPTSSRIRTVPSGAPTAPVPSPPDEALQRRCDTLEQLAHVGIELMGILSEDVLIERLLDTATAIFRVDAASLLLVDWENMQLFFREARGPVRNQLMDVRLPLEEDHSIAGWVVTHRQMVSVADVTADPRHNRAADEAFGYQTRNLLAAPVVHGKDVLGVIELLNKEGGFDDQDAHYLEILASYAAMSLANTMAMHQLHNYYQETVETMIDLYQAFDPVSHQHVLDVARLATAIGQELGLAQSDMETLCYASLLHDIGKTRCADPEDPLHAVQGARMLGQITLFGRLGPVVQCHHERHDGSGAPYGLKGEEIPPLARILAVADCWCEEVDSGQAPTVPAFAERFGQAFDPVLRDPFLRAMGAG